MENAKLEFSLYYLLKTMFLVVIILGLFALTYLYFFRESFLAELAISFLPYWMLLLIIFAIALLGVLIVLLWRKLKIQDLKLKIVVLCLLCLRSTVLGVMYASEFFSFYAKQDTMWINQAWMRVYYANILYTNYDYESLKKQIEANNPHVVVLVEFSSQHEEALKDWFQERFPYVNRNSRSTKLAGDVVFSKYPIRDLLVNYPQESGRWRYSYFSMQHGEKELYFYVVHTSAPVSVYNFNMRNEQLKKLNEEFLLQARDRPEDIPVVMIGDFNVSPWSAFYKSFEKRFEGILRNIARDYRPFFTWSLWAQEILIAHIDHIFVSDDIQIGAFYVEDLPGSDHHAIIFDVESKKYWKKLMDEMEKMVNNVR